MEVGNIKVITDHKSLRYIHTKEQLVRIIRFLESIEHHDKRIVYRHGKEDLLVHYLSRPPSLLSTDDHFLLMNEGKKKPRCWSIQHRLTPQTRLIALICN